jgi:TRAP-type mannitol/chloroaromatic compound transport system permease small subunit
MPRAIRAYVAYVDAVNRRVGWFAMYIIFGAMFGVLLYSSFARVAFNAAPLWGIEMAQFLMAAYYILGGGYAMQDASHVRMDLIWTRFSPRGRAIIDLFTAFFLVGYLVLLLYGGLSSTIYSFEVGQRNVSAWAPHIWPIKVVMVTGIVLVLLQVMAIFFKDWALARGERLA